ncbi:MAG TPA: type I-D CRISPR-associated protein Cas5/Csc1 [Caldilineaceae bacterium]|nr:type I-D CRISPR-associated protein Cas5/Csc1 [Caldilineaceae bacterium]
MQIFRCQLTLMERTFFSSREVGNFYQTEPFIGNYALCYALGLVAAPYHNRGKIHYAEHLAALNEQGIYLTSASIVGQPRFAIEQFNAMPDSYWFAMGNNALITKPDGWDAEQRGTAWYLSERATGASRKVRTLNRPQIGSIKLLGIGNRAVFYVFTGDDSVRLPSYIRLGKWMSKARVLAEKVSFQTVAQESVQIRHLINPLDLASGTVVHTFDLLSVHPVPLLRNAVISGSFYRLSDGTLLPAGMRFGVEGLTAND